LQVNQTKGIFVRKRLPILLLAACSVQAADKLSTVSVYGLSVPGTPTTAKESGFTKCEDSKTYYLCFREKKTVIAGVAARKAAIAISGADSFSESGGEELSKKVTDFSSADLSYRRVEMTFSSNRELEDALRSDGWLKSVIYENEYYKEGIAATFAFYKTYVALEPRHIYRVNGQVDMAKGQFVENTQSESKAKSFIDSMKK
jgi:hypothetical protein